MSISPATASASSVHTNALTTHTCCNKCNYMHSLNKSPTYCQQCYACGGSNHFTALCKEKHRRPRQPCNTTPEEHDCHLMCLMETTTEHGIIFNSTKCQIRQPQITFYGTVFTAQGMWPEPSKSKPSKTFSHRILRQSFSPA